MGNKKKENQKGTIVLESVFAIIVCLIVLMFFISFGFYLYQKSLVSIVANEVSESVAITYKYKDLSDMSSITQEDISGVGFYRYFFHRGKFESKANEKALALAEAHLSATSLAQSQGSLSVKVERETELFGRAHYKVEISQKYNFLMGKLLEPIGIDVNKPITAVAYSESVDVLSYTNSVKFTKYVAKKAIEYPIMGAADSIFEMFQSAISMFKTIFGA